MTYEADLYTYLSTHADASSFRSLIGSRLYWLEIPQNPTFPYVRIVTADARPVLNLGGVSTYQESFFNFHINSPVHTSCINIRESLRTLFHGKIITSGSTKFSQCIMTDFAEAWIDDTPAGFVNAVTSFKFFHKDT